MDLLAKVERAFDYRGDVTLDLVDGSQLTGFLFNRRADGTDPYVEVFPTGQDAPVRLSYGQISDIRLTGEDHFKPFGA